MTLPHPIKSHMAEIFLLLLVVASTIVMSVNADAHDGATGVVKERHDEMKSLKLALKALKTTLDTGQIPDRAELKAISDQLARPAGARLLALFPKDGPLHKSDALPVIWTEWDTFSRSAMDMEARAVSLATAKSDMAVLRSEMGAIARICKECHDRFRKR
jgi:cytochrome c556